MATGGRARHALGTLCPVDGSTLRRLGGHVSLSCTDRGFWIVRAATNLVCGPSLVRSPFCRAWTDRCRYCVSCDLAYRCRTFSSFRAQGWRPDAYDHWLTGTRLPSLGPPLAGRVGDRGVRAPACEQPAAMSAAT